jgi:hypothetical protein
MTPRPGLAIKGADNLFGGLGQIGRPVNRVLSAKTRKRLLQKLVNETLSIDEIRQRFNGTMNTKLLVAQLQTALRDKTSESSDKCLTRISGVRPEQ